MHNGIEWFRSQLAVVQWSLDAAVTAPAEVARAHLRRARQVYRALRQALPQANFGHEERPEIDRALDEISVRLQIDARET
jgi:hypothetical protein